MPHLQEVLCRQVQPARAHPDPLQPQAVQVPAVQQGLCPQVLPVQAPGVLLHEDDEGQSERVQETVTRWPPPSDGDSAHGARRGGGRAEGSVCREPCPPAGDPQRISSASRPTDDERTAQTTRRIILVNQSAFPPPTILLYVKRKNYSLYLFCTFSFFKNVTQKQILSFSRDGYLIMR